MSTMTASHFVISPPPKSMQQIAILIITFAVYVAGIRNGNNEQTQAANSNENANSASADKYQSSDFFPSQPLSSMPETQNSAASRQSYSGFQPMQVFSFTAADVPNERPHYPPSYIEPDYHSSTKLQEYASQKYARMETQKQFAFPAAAPPTKYSYNGLYEQSTTYKPSYYQSNYNNQPITEPPPPILTYLDPYTNQDYASATPQEYTVQSSLIVGQQHNRPSKYSSSYMRPGYVFDEQLHASSSSAPHTQQREDVAAPPTAGSKISYDSHDYPPPSYAQLQTSNFEQVPPTLQQDRPQPRPTPPPPPPPQPRPTAPNYSSDSYYTPPQQQQQQQHYYRPTPTYERPRPTAPPPPPPPPPQQQSQPPYRQEFIYRPLGSRPPQGAARPPPSYNNYYEYQLGEVPPGPRPPYRPPLQQQQQQQPATSGLASLASLFGQNSPQQYAPQFGSGPLGSLLGALAPGLGQQQSQPQYGGQPQRPLNMQLIRALENIARNDDLQCVPKVLCQMIAGQTQRGQLPSFITSPALTNFLSIFPASSPALIYGRAALLGISGGESSCTQTYLQCPKNEYEILHYLNNHRGGFFKFFSEPEPEQQQAPQHSSQSAAGGGGGFGGGGGGGASSFLSILAALTGNPVVAPTTTTPRPTAPPPQAATADITSGIGNFFTNLLSEYVGGGSVEYQRRRKRNKRAALRFGDDEEKEESKGEQSNVRQSKPLKFMDDDDQAEVYDGAADEMLADEDFHDEEDNEDTQLDKQIRFLTDAVQADTAAKASHGIRFADDDGDEEEKSEAKEAFQFPDVSGRILNKPDAILAEEPQQFFPADISEGERKLRVLVAAFNRLQAGRKLRFPTGTDDRLYVEVEDAEKQKKRLKAGKALRLSEVESNSLEQPPQQPTPLVFKDIEESDPLSGNLHYLYVQPSGKIRFPDQLNTQIRKGRILNRPTYASDYEQYIGADKAQRVVFETQPDQHRQPHYQTHTATINNNYNSLIQQQQLQQQHIQTNTLNNYYNQQSYTPTPSTHTYNQPHYANAYQQHYNGASAATSATQTQQSQQRPYRKYEDDKNVYVTNGQGVTEYYITPDGRKIYIR